MNEQRKIIEYKLLLEYNEQYLTGKVNEHIKDGWELYGNPSIAVGHDSNGISERIIQVVVKYDKEII
jgi:hypothetical protein